LKYSTVVRKRLIEKHSKKEFALLFIVESNQWFYKYLNNTVEANINIMIIDKIDTFLI